MRPGARSVRYRSMRARLLLALTLLPGPAWAQDDARRFTVPVADAPGATLGLAARIDRATGAATAELRADVRVPAGTTYDAASYVTDLGPVERALATSSAGGVEHLALPIEVDQLEAFVAEGEPWRLTLEGAQGRALAVTIPVAGIAEFLDEIGRYQASHPPARGL